MLIKNPITSLIATGWKYAGKRRHLIVFYLILFAGSEATALAEPYIVGRILNCVQTGASGTGKGSEPIFHQILFYLGLLLLTQIGFWVFHGPGRLIERFVAFHIKADYKTALFRMVTELPLQWHREHHSGDSIDKINKASKALQDFFDETFELSYMIFRFVGAQLILFWFMPTAGYACVIASICALTTVVLFDRVLMKRYKALNGFDNRAASAVHDYVTNIISVITLRLQGRVIGEVRRRLEAPLNLFYGTNVMNETKWCLTTVTIALMTMFVLVWYAWSNTTAGKVLMAGTFFTLFEYLRRVGESFYNFAYIYGNTVQRAADVENAAPLIESYNALTDRGAEHSMPKQWQTIEVSNLYFTYADEKQRMHHLENVDVTLSKGKAIAFVGESGSGKSTLLNLLRGMQTADKVDVSCDGKRLVDQLKHLSNVTTLLPQDPEIFADTIKFNITFGLDATQEQIEKAVRLARFDSVLARLPEGLETNIAEKGVNLSGGEKQRLALARGLFFAKDSEILLLDEPTSSVDQHNERLIYGNILSEFKSKCIVSSIHKLNLLNLFDYIYVFQDGSIVEQGTLDELLGEDGRLSALYRHSIGTSHDIISEVLPTAR
jgi:ABC-type multidrug transport system fused ATPase/permease subunit